MSKPLNCGCLISPGGPIPYSDLRAHITGHVPAGLRDLTEQVFMMELLRGLNPGNDPEHKFYLEIFVPFRSRLMELSAEYDEKIKPGLEKIWPENPLAEALL